MATNEKRKGRGGREGGGWGDEILLLLLGSYQGPGHYPTQRSAKFVKKGRCLKEK